MLTIPRRGVHAEAVFQLNHDDDEIITQIKGRVGARDIESDGCIRRRSNTSTSFIPLGFYPAVYLTRG